MTDTPSTRLTRIETIVGQHAEMLRRIVSSLERIAVVDERMASQMEDNRRLHDRVDTIDASLQEVKQEMVEIKAFYRDIKSILIALLLAALTTGGGFALWLVQFWMEHP
ncbi:MAG: hypothetical protein H6974_12955 [Gammaproteobacteria bacterium]|nr:hypothetical protein [Gammaproteobacteria bacterium]